MDFQATMFARKCGDVLPSPPQSPSMYAYPPAPGEHSRYNTRLATRHILPAPSGGVTFRLAESVRQGDDKVPASLSQASPSRDGRTSPHSSSSLQQIVPLEQPNTVISCVRTPESSSPDRESDHLREQRPTRAFSTASHTTPQLVLTEAEHVSEGDELLTGSEEEDTAGGAIVVKSGAERLAEKRKMKRFRLTHAQTRYLMSEFSRQAHPDAAQRERLSRDIPGLNTRQVQVWFQNRRAKLKRLTSDDQERMRRSRALPEDFDFSQTLQPTIRDVRPSYGSVLTDPLMLGGGTCQKPTLRLGTGQLSMASHNMSSIFTNNALSPASATGSANPSPVSSGNEGSERSSAYYSTTQSPLVNGSQFTYPFGRSYSLSVGSPAFQGQARPSSQNGTTGPISQPHTATAPSRPALACNSYGNLPPLQFSRTPFQTRDSHHFDRFQTTEGLSHENGMAMNQHYISPLPSPSSVCYDQSQMLHPSNSGFRVSPYYQSPDTIFWHGNQMSSGGQAYEQQTRPHRTTEQRPGSQPSPSLHSPVSSVDSYNQGSYSHSSEQYSKMSSSTDAQAQQPTQIHRGSDANTGANTLPPPAAARPRARSDTYPAYYNTQ